MATCFVIIITVFLVIRYTGDYFLERVHVHRVGDHACRRDVCYESTEVPTPGYMQCAAKRAH